MPEESRPPNAHRQQIVRLLRLFQGVSKHTNAKESHVNPYGRKPVQMQVLWKDIYKFRQQKQAHESNAPGGVLEVEDWEKANQVQLELISFFIVL